MNRKFFLSATSIGMTIVNPYMWAGFNFDNLCAVDDEVGTNFTGSYEVKSFDDDINITLTFDSNTTVYRFCEQNLLALGKFPATPMHQDTGLRWMSREQELGTVIFGWVGVGVTIVIAFIIIGHIVSNFFCRKTVKMDKIKKPPFFAAGPEVSTYIPEVKSNFFPYPLIACQVKDFDEKLFDWKSPYQPYAYYDLTLDAEALVQEDKEDGNEIRLANRAFSKVRYWELSNT